jgi:hypothetical protein
VDWLEIAHWRIARRNRVSSAALVFVSLRLASIVFVWWRKKKRKMHTTWWYAQYFQFAWESESGEDERNEREKINFSWKFSSPSRQIFLLHPSFSLFAFNTRSYLHSVSFLLLNDPLFCIEWVQGTLSLCVNRSATHKAKNILFFLIT